MREKSVAPRCPIHFQVLAEKFGCRMAGFMKQQIGIVEVKDETGFRFKNLKGKGADSHTKDDKLSGGEPVPVDLSHLQGLVFPDRS